MGTFEKELEILSERRQQRQEREIPCEGYTFDGIMLDITKPGPPVEVNVRADGKVVWVNIGATCVLRVCGIQGLTVIDNR
jgi:hypothetical protein